MTIAEWGGILAGMVAIAASFLTSLRWMVRQFVNELGNQLATRIDKLEATQELLVERQSAIYETLLSEGVTYAAKENKGSKARKPTRKRARS
jgi:predicted PurR-regulated permease PerM